MRTQNRQKSMRMTSAVRMPHPTLLQLALAVLLAAAAVAASALAPAPLATPAAVQAAARIGPGLQQRLADAADGEQLQVIVTFHGRGAPRAEQLAALAGTGVSGLHLRSFPMAGVTATPIQIRQIAALPEVRSVYHNDRLEYENEGATHITGVRRLREDAVLANANGGIPFTGRGVTVLVNDSGIDGTHEDLRYPDHVIQNVYAGSNLAAWDDTVRDVACTAGACVGKILPITWVEDVPNTDFSGSHGTHVAGIVGGSGARSGGKYAGVAPGASLVGYGSGAALFILDALGGFDYAKTYWATYNIRVVTNSFGSPSQINQPFDPEHPTNLVTQELAEDFGMVIVFSAGNSGNGENTITGVFKKAPWVILAANGTKDGRLAPTSSRGQIGFSGTYTDAQRGITYTLTDRPTVTTPGTAIIAARALSADPLPLIAAGTDSATIAQEHLPYYTTKSGTSMAAPHVAGIVALMLEANPALGWRDVKAMLEQTATNVADLGDWEGGAGYANAYAAVAMAAAARPGSPISGQDYGATNRLHRSFQARALMQAVHVGNFPITYAPVNNPATGNNFANFDVGPGVALVLASGNVSGETDGLVTGQTIRIALEDPDGVLYSPGVGIPGGALSGYRTVTAPGKPGTWKVLVRGTCGLSGTVTISVCSEDVDTNGLGTPTRVNALVKAIRTEGFEGLGDIAGHPLQGFIEVAVANQLVDGRADGVYEPDAALSRIELAEYLSLNPGLRQHLPLDGQPTFTDVADAQRPFAEAAAAPGAFLLDSSFAARPAIVVEGEHFGPAADVKRLQFAYGLVQALGLQGIAEAHTGSVTYELNGTEHVVDDLEGVASELRGYAQLALDFGFVVPKVQDIGQDRTRIRFRPQKPVTRAEYARAAVRAAAIYAPR